MKIYVALLVLVLLLVLPYVAKTYGLKNITASDLPVEGGWAELSQGNLYYRWYIPEHENGEIVVLVHGFSTPHFVWDQIKNFLIERGYKVLVYDHFGRGFSQRPNIRYDKAVYVESLNELLAHQQVSQSVHLVGYSMGGAVIGHFTQAYPTKTKTLSLIAPAGFMPGTQAVNRLVTLPVVGEWLGHMVAKNMLVSDVSDTEMANIDDPLAMEKLDFISQVSAQLSYSGYVESLISTFRYFNLFDAQDAFSAIGGEHRIPTLAIWGTQDATVPYSGTVHMLEAIPYAELLTIEQGGHNIPYMQPSIVGSGIVDFLDRSILSHSAD
jgi:pimeloyl-ACP methyl ester carboxylesterase